MTVVITKACTELLRKKYDKYISMKTIIEAFGIGKSQH